MGGLSSAKTSEMAWPHEIRNLAGVSFRKLLVVGDFIQSERILILQKASLTESAVTTTSMSQGRPMSALKGVP